MELSGLNANLAGKLAEANAGREVSALARAARQEDPDEAGKEFEAMLGTMLAREMRRGLDEGFFGKGPGGDTFSSWLDEYIGRTMAERGTLGTGGLVKAFVANLAEGADAEGEEGVQ